MPPPAFKTSVYFNYDYIIVSHILNWFCHFNHLITFLSPVLPPFGLPRVKPKRVVHGKQKLISSMFVLFL